MNELALGFRPPPILTGGDPNILLAVPKFPLRLLLKPIPELNGELPNEETLPKERAGGMTVADELLVVFRSLAAFAAAMANALVVDLTAKPLRACSFDSPLAVIAPSSPIGAILIL